MSNRIKFFVLALLLTFFSCQDNSEVTGNVPTINKIMPLGASRVEGARPVHESYRYELWKLLVDNNWVFDFIGTMNDPASYPVYLGQGFDDDHEGRGGLTSGQILTGINNWLAQAGAPDVVLFSSPGGNDALQNLPYADAINNINAIIDAIQASNPNVTIIIEKLAPARSDQMTPTLTAYFNQMQQDITVIATQQSTLTSQVTVVDIATGFNDSFFADSVHYNETGAAFVASRYYNVLINVLR
ncbi:MAG: hypothetical protein JXQ93_03815 [Flavobacteriaceae bacterium]